LPFISIDESPLIPGSSSVEIHYRDYGRGRPLIFLHGGWGYQIYPFDSQIEDYWRKLIVNNGSAWLRLADESGDPTQDLYDGKLSKLTMPTLFIHGSRDPRTEPGEIDAVRRELPEARFEILEGAGHSPHSASFSAEACTRVAANFLESLPR
jgi:pimeloyl-ACP methyl ester carboxylesterase